MFCRFLFWLRWFDAPADDMSKTRQGLPYGPCGSGGGGREARQDKTRQGSSCGWCLACDTPSPQVTTPYITYKQRCPSTSSPLQLSQSSHCEAFYLPLLLLRP